MNTLTTTREHLEHQATSLKNSEIDLVKGEAYQLVLDKTSNGEANLAATIHTAKLEDSEYEDVHDGSTDEVLLFDLRGVPIEEQGYKIFNGQMLTANAEYILVNPMKLDWEKGLGYKGLRAGESFTYGKPGADASPTDKRRRFGATSPFISRNHFTVTVTEAGEVEVKDTSTNGTSIATGEKAIDAVRSSGFVQEENEVTVTKTRLQEQREELAQDSFAGEGKLLDADTIHSLVEKSHDRKQHALTRELLSTPEYAPVAGINVDGKDFYFSRIQVDGDRPYAFGYVDSGKTDEPIKPRLFYKSKSDGGWRSSPYVLGDGHISKGDISNYGGYVQLTKPVDAITQLLEAVEASNEPKNTNFNFSQGVLENFGSTRVTREGIYDFKEQVQPVMFAEGDDRYPGLNAYEPGQGYTESATSARHHIETMQLPRDFEPDFTKPPIRAFEQTHTLAGKIVINVHRTMYQDRALDWHVAADAQGNVWLDKVAAENGGVSTYGTSKEPILLGALSAKPFEYASQTHNMQRGVDYDDFDRSYVDLRQKYWGKMPWVKRYKQAQLGIK